MVKRSRPRTWQNLEKHHTELSIVSWSCRGARRNVCKVPAEFPTILNGNLTEALS